METEHRVQERSKGFPPFFKIHFITNLLKMTVFHDFKAMPLYLFMSYNRKKP